MRTFGRWTLAVLAVLALSSVGPFQAEAAPTGLYSTGVDASNALLPNNALDPHYTLTVNPDLGNPGTNMYATWSAMVGIGPWLPNDLPGDPAPRTRWISPSTGFSDSLGGGVDYTIRTTFFLGAPESFSGQWSSDNQTLDILVNGGSTGFNSSGWGPPPPLVTPNTGFYKLWDFTIGSGFTMAGLNTLDFIVENAATSVSSPLGLRVEFTYDPTGPPPPPPSVPEPATLLLLGSGLVALAFRAWRKGRH